MLRMESFGNINDRRYCEGSFWLNINVAALSGFDIVLQMYELTMEND